MKTSRVVLLAVALLCVPAGLILLLVAVLHENPLPDRPPPAFITTTSTGPAAWLLDTTSDQDISLTPAGGASIEPDALDGALALDGDTVLGGVIRLSMPEEIRSALGVDPDGEARFVIDGTYEVDVVIADGNEVAQRDEQTQAMRGTLVVGGREWSIVGRGRFGRFDGLLELDFTGSDEDAAGAGALMVEIGVAFSSD